MANVDSLSTVERQEYIYRQLNERKHVRLTDLSEELGISIATARRDLESLAEQGKAQRVHGGAILTQKAPPEMAVHQREVEQAAEKCRIGAAAANLIEDGDTVFISSGTTAYEVARNLVNRQNLTVITNSLPVLVLLANNPNISVICLGGVLRHSEASYIGHLTELSLAEIRADKVIFGIRALHLEEGLTNDYLAETMIDRKILKIGREVIIVADYTKLDRISTAFVAPLSAIKTLVTDAKAPAAFTEGLREHGIRVIIA